MSPFKLPIVLTLILSASICTSCSGNTDSGDEAITVRIRSEGKNGENWCLQESFVRSGSMLVKCAG